MNDRVPENNDILNDLSSAECGRDQTDQIMRRLGFQKVTSTERRQATRRRRAGRVTLVALVGLVAAGSWYALQTSGSVRRPTGPTVPTALHETIQSQQNRFNRTINTLRSLTPQRIVEPRSATPEPAPIEPAVREDIDRSAVALVRWL